MGFRVANVCKFEEGEDTTWRCAKIEWKNTATAPSIISSGYEWTCCLPNKQDVSCQDVDVSFSEFRSEHRKATISLDDWEVDKGTVLRKHWGNCGSKKLCRWNKKIKAKHHHKCDEELHGKQITSRALAKKAGAASSSSSSSSMAKATHHHGEEKGKAHHHGGTGGVREGIASWMKRKRASLSSSSSSSMAKATHHGEGKGKGIASWIKRKRASAKKEYDDIDDGMYDDDDYYDQDLAAQQNVLMDQYEYDVAVEAAKERRAVERLRNEKRKIDRLKKKMHSS